jgi:hypothetical protein
MTSCHWHGSHTSTHAQAHNYNYTGAAVAVALGRTDFALAPDALGEARIPAACCSVYAYRPTPGLLSAVLPGSSRGAGGSDGSAGAAEGGSGEGGAISLVGQVRAEGVFL